MRYDVLFILLSFFVSIANFSPTTENECKRNADATNNMALKRFKDFFRRIIECRDDVWLRSNADKTTVYVSMKPNSAQFDEDSGELVLKSRVATGWEDKRLAWKRSDSKHIFSTKFQQPDIAFISVGNEDIYKREKNEMLCYSFWDGSISCDKSMVQTIKCQTDLTLWPYGHHTCTVVITSWFFTTEQLVLSDKYSSVDLGIFKSDGEWNLSVSRVNRDHRKSQFYDNVEYPQITIEFDLYRLHSHLKMRFVAPIVLMMVMTLTTLWLEPKSYERLAVASLNIIIHLMCLQDLHWVLPRNGTAVPNILLFYINSFILATVALLLTFLLGKMNDTKISAPKWISSNIDRLLASKAGQILLLSMLDPKVMATIETSADDTNILLSSEPKELTWKYTAIFLSWISFFSFFFTYILMYILLIPHAPWNGPWNIR